jgi:hypothetical protein
MLLFFPSAILISSSVRAYSRAPIDLPVRGLDLALQRGHLVRRAGFRELFVLASICSTREAIRIVAGDIGGVGSLIDLR